MRRPILIASLLFSLAWSAQADVTLRSTVSGTGFGALGNGESVTYLQGHKMLIEHSSDVFSTATLFDIDKQQMVVINHKKKKGDQFDVREAAEMQRMIRPEDIQVKFTATDEHKQILGWDCQKYLMEIRVLGAGMPEMPMSVVIKGQAWLAPDAPGKQEYAAFYLAAAEKGYFFGDPNAARTQPGRERAMTSMYKAMAEAGLPLASEITVSFEGSGLLAQMMEKMKTTLTTTVTAISNDALPAERFAIPADIKIKHEE